MNAESQTTAGGILDEYISEKEMAEARGVTERTLRGERLRGDGPPYVRDGRRILYHVPGYRAWLKARMRLPVRGPMASAERQKASA